MSKIGFNKLEWSLRSVTELGNSCRVSSTGKIGRKPDLDHFQRVGSFKDTSAKAEDIGVVVFPAHFRSIDICTIGRPDAPVPVGGYRHANPGPTDEYSHRAFASHNALHRFLDEIGIIHRIFGKTADIYNLMAGVNKILLDCFLQIIPTVIGRDDNFHLSFLLKKPQSTTFFKAITALVPPKPKEFESAARIFIFLATFGT